LGGIGEAGNFLEINADLSLTGSGVLRAFDTTAASTNGIFIDEVVGDLRVHSVETLGNVSLRTTGGSIIDARNDAAANVLGRSIDLDANGANASIGSDSNEFEIDSRIGSADGVDDVGLEATANIYLTETSGNLRLVLAHAYSGDIRLTVRESTAQGEDFELLHDGSARFAEDASTLPGNDPDAPRLISHGQVFAEAGSVTLRVGDNVTLDSNSEIVAAKGIDIYGDWGNADDSTPDDGDAWGTRMVLRGKLVAGAIVTAGDPFSPANGNPVGSYLPNLLAPTSAEYMTNIWGGIDSDTINFGDITGAAGGTNWGDAGYIFIGAKTRVHAGANEDFLHVYFLQDAAVTTSPAKTFDAQHTLRLDGQAGTDSYEVHTLGSQGDARNYVVNVLDTGAPDDGVDELTVFGFDSKAQGSGVDDIFLLRSAAFLPGETADRPGYVAMLHGNVNTYTDVLGTTNASLDVQRINYDTALNGRLTVQGLGGNDVFASDDSTVTVTLDGGAGNDDFRIGQIFGEKRNILAGGLLAQDVFPTMVATTRGWLSAGISAPMVVHGGTGDDNFTVYSNQAELRLEGDDDDDTFVVRAFALAQVNPGATDSWIDDEILLDADGVAKPRIGADYSTGRPLDIRTGGGEDEVQYNINAPVSIDGGTGFDKVVILGTEFADDFVITDKGIYGGGLNVRFANVEVVEVDGLEGDDEFFVRSTAFGVSYRVIGGLGSDTINVAGDVTEDIVTRELEGVSGTVNHRLTSADIQYNGLVVDGFDYNVASPTEGAVVITQSGGFTAVRESTGNGIEAFDSYTVELAFAPTSDVYITVSAARSPQEEEDGTLINPDDLANGIGDTMWLSTSADPDALLQTQFERTVTIDGRTFQVPNRAVVLKFTATDYGQKTVYVFAKDDDRAEGDRVVVTQHSVISTDARFDAVDVANVEVQLRDNDTPGVYVTQVTPGTTTEDGRTLVIEGDATTGLSDEVLVRLAKAPTAEVVVKLVLDAASDQQIALLDLADPNNTNSRMFKGDDGIWRIRFNAGNWNDAVRVGIQARDDFRREDPGTAVISFERDDTLSLDAGYIFPNLRSGTGLLAIEVIDNDTAGVVVQESNNSSQLIKGSAATDDYTIRLTQQPTANVQVAILTDGLADVVSIGGVAVTLQEIGGLRPSQLFTGGIIFANVDGKGTLTRGVGDDLGNFNDDGFFAGQWLRIAGTDAFKGDYVVESVTENVVTLKTALGATGVTVSSGVILSNLTREGQWNGEVRVESETVDLNPSETVEQFVTYFRLDRTDNSGWLADGFLEGQRVRVYNAANASQYADFKIAIIRGENAGKDDKIEFTLATTTLPSWLTGTLNVKVTRLAAVATFTSTNWYQAQTVALRADALFEVPIVRQGVKEFPVSTHLLSKLQGPLAVGRRRDRCQPRTAERPQAARREGRLFDRDWPANSRVAADRRAQHLQRLEPAGPWRHHDLDLAERLWHGHGSGLCRHGQHRRAEAHPGRHQLRQDQLRCDRFRHRRRPEHHRGGQPAARRGQRQPADYRHAGPGASRVSTKHLHLRRHSGRWHGQPRRF